MFYPTVDGGANDGRTGLCAFDIKTRNVTTSVILVWGRTIYLAVWEEKNIKCLAGTSRNYLEPGREYFSS